MQANKINPAKVLKNTDNQFVLNKNKLNYNTLNDP